MKQILFLKANSRRVVTPFVGVWIETEYYIIISKRRRVTPFVGVWIETLWYLQNNWQAIVTPFVGVWIETRNFATTEVAADCHTLRGCVD